MSLNFDITSINNNLEPKKGRLLLSEPLSNDLFFNRSVVFLTEHNNKGSIGFTLNKKSNLKLPDLLDNVTAKIPVYIGGPVTINSIFFIHRLNYLIDDSVNVIDDIYWGGNFNQVIDLINDNIINEKNAMFFIGYSGWDKNQLQNEIKNNNWLVIESNKEIIFSKNNETLWNNIVKSFDNKYKLWQNIPINPGLN